MMGNNLIVQEFPFSVIPVQQILTQQGKQKAVKQRADVFLMPQKNYSEALKFSHGIRIIPVDDFDDIIMKLIKL